MCRSVTRIATIAVIGLLATTGCPHRLQAQTYSIDCAILLCLSGGWPASVPCAGARAEFIRRITPWPIEPPLQVWRCPMAATHSLGTDQSSAIRFYDISHGKKRTQKLRFSVPFTANLQKHAKRNTFPDSATLPNSFLEGSALLPVQERADVDISGPAFNFIRSIRVYNVRYARQQESDQSGDCNRLAMVSLGAYGIQGDFSWSLTSPINLPYAHTGLENWGDHCPNISHRSVFVDWRDSEGNYGFEQVDY